MTRTTPDSVAKIFDTDLDTTSGGALEQWVEIAHTVVDDIASADSSISGTRLEQIEKLLAAGYAAAQDPRLNSTSRETASADYQRNDKWPNDYIAQAVALDPTGVIANQYKRTATLEVPDARGLND